MTIITLHSYNKREILELFIALAIYPPVTWIKSQHHMRWIRHLEFEAEGQENPNSSFMKSDTCIAALSHRNKSLPMYQNTYLYQHSNIYEGKNQGQLEIFIHHTLVLDLIS